MGKLLLGLDWFFWLRNRSRLPFVLCFVMFRLIEVEKKTVLKSIIFDTRRRFQANAVLAKHLLTHGNSSSKSTPTENTQSDKEIHCINWNDLKKVDHRCLSGYPNKHVLRTHKPTTRQKPFAYQSLPSSRYTTIIPYTCWSWFATVRQRTFIIRRKTSKTMLPQVQRSASIHNSFCASTTLSDFRAKSCPQFNT